MVAWPAAEQLSGEIVPSRNITIAAIKISLFSAKHFDHHNLFNWLKISPGHLVRIQHTSELREMYSNQAGEVRRTDPRQRLRSFSVL